MVRGVDRLEKMRAAAPPCIPRRVPDNRSGARPPRGPGMVSVCRCPRGHTWVPSSGAPGTCPVCGDTALTADDVTQLFVAPVVDDPTPPTAGELTQQFPAVPPADPSFASLTGTAADRRESSAVDLANP